MYYTKKKSRELTIRCRRAADYLKRKETIKQERNSNVLMIVFGIAAIILCLVLPVVRAFILSLGA